ncbi:TIGR00180 family glycosyltransferase [Candidatus Thioglobus sp.]|jgi:glycosyltransferase domain-containing protein|nr:TIGR00180 family glycosyltransferase [Candidatus Thioglobus sp.]
MKDKLTIIIPSHERQNLLDRAIDYYSSWDCKIIIVDSSKVKYIKKIPNNVQYLHCPGNSIGNKLYQATLEVTTAYTCLSADDDFLAKYALKIGIEYLDSNESYVSVSGNIISFIKSDNKFHIRPIDYLLESNSGYHVDSDLIQDRVKFSVGRQHEYALHRSIISKKCMKVVQNLDNISPFHFTFSLLSMCYGKHITLPLFWQARDTERYSSYFVKPGVTSTWHNQQPNTKEDPVNIEVMDWSEYLSSEEGIRYRENFINEIKDIIKIKTERGVLFDSALMEYSSRLSNRILWYELKQYIPRFLWNLYVLNRDSERVSLKLQNNYSKSQGYPWVDSNSSKDWDKISITLKKFLP